MKIDNIIFEKVINSYEPLKDWYLKNQDEIVLIESDTINNSDLNILKKMIISALKWINIVDAGISIHAKAFNASESIYKIYKQEYDNLSESAREKYFINVHQNTKNNRLIIVKHE